MFQGLWLHIGLLSVKFKTEQSAFQSLADDSIDLNVQEKNSFFLLFSLVCISLAQTNMLHLHCQTIHIFPLLCGILNVCETKAHMGYLFIYLFFWVTYFKIVFYLTTVHNNLKLLAGIRAIIPKKLILFMCFIFLASAVEWPITKPNTYYKECWPIINYVCGSHGDASLICCFLVLCSQNNGFYEDTLF